MESARMTSADRRWVIKEVFSFFFFATGPEDEDDEDDDEDDEKDHDDDVDDDGDEYLELWVEEQDTEEASCSHCAPRVCFQIFFPFWGR